MKLVKTIYDIIIEALFPLSAEERELAMLAHEKAESVLPAAPLAPFQNMSAAFAYTDSRVKRLIWGTKYKKSGHATDIGGYALYLAARRIAGETRSPTIIIPLPMTPRRKRERGFDQCESLALALKKHDADGQFSVRNDILSRVKHGSRQTLKDRSGRIEGAHDIFVAQPATGLDSGGTSGGSTDMCTIVIDDVITTGSTMREAIETLEKAGYTNVRGIAVAH